MAIGSCTENFLVETGECCGGQVSGGALGFSGPNPLLVLDTQLPVLHPTMGPHHWQRSSRLIRWTDPLQPISWPSFLSMTMADYSYRAVEAHVGDFTTCHSVKRQAVNAKATAAHWEQLHSR